MKSTVERRMEIANLVGVRGKISVNTLSEYFCVSGATIRTDLRFLENMGYVVRSNGYVLLNKGAISRFIQPQNRSERTNSVSDISLDHEKQETTNYYTDFIKNSSKPFLDEPDDDIGQSIFIAAGVYTRKWVQQQNWNSKYIVTNDILLPSLITLRDQKTKIFILGGQVNIEKMSVDIAGAEQNLMDYRLENTVIEVEKFIPGKGFFFDAEQKIRFVHLLRKITEKLTFIIKPEEKNSQAIHLINDVNLADKLLYI